MLASTCLYSPYAWLLLLLLRPRERLRSIVMSMSSVCLSVRGDISGITLAIFANILCMLPMSVARSSSGTLTIGRIAYRREGGDGSAQRGRSVINDCLVVVFVVVVVVVVVVMCVCVRACMRVLYYPSYLYLYFFCTFHVCRSAAIFADDVIFPANTHFRCNCQISVVVAVCHHCTCRNCCNNNNNNNNKT